MSNEIRVVFISGASLTADVFYGDSGIRQSDIVLTESPSGSGRYTGDCAAIQPNDDIIIYENSVPIAGATYKSDSATAQAVSDLTELIDAVQEAVDLIAAPTRRYKFED